MKLVGKLVLILIPFIAVLSVFAFLNDRDISFTMIMNNLQNYDDSFLNQTKSILDTMVDGFSSALDFTTVSNPLDFLTNVGTILAGIFGIPVTFVVYLVGIVINFFNFTKLFFIF